MENTLKRALHLRMRTGVSKIFALALVVAAIFSVQSVSAQSSFSTSSAINAKDYGGTLVYLDQVAAISVLKQEVATLTAQTEDAAGTSLEADNSIRVEFFTGISDRISNGESVESALQLNYGQLLGRAGAFNQSLNLVAIRDRAVDILTEQ